MLGQQMHRLIGAACDGGLKHRLLFKVVLALREVARGRNLAVTV